MAAMVEFKNLVLTADERELHLKALACAARYLKAELEMFCLVDTIDRKRLYEKFAVNSTYSYCTEILGLTPAVSSNFICVARKSREIPKLRRAVLAGLSLSKARKIAPVLTPANCDEWLVKAHILKQRDLEREVAVIVPIEKIRSSKDRVEFQFSLSWEAAEKFRRVQGILSSRISRTPTVEETFTAALERFLERKSRVSATHAPASTRYIHSALRHSVFERDRGRCQARFGNEICGRMGFLHLHHIVPLELGGLTTAENLITLCSDCHRRLHSQAV